MRNVRKNNSIKRDKTHKTTEGGQGGDLERGRSR